MEVTRAHAALIERDAVLSRLSDAAWPHGPLLDLLRPSPGADVLDIGAGNGALLREWRRRGGVGRTVGLDPHPPGAGTQGNLRRGVAQALPYRTGACDVALLVRTLSHLGDPDAALREAWRVLRSGGRLVLAAHGADHLRSTWHALGRPVGDATGGAGPEDALRAALTRANRVALRLDVRRAVTVTAADAHTLTRTYGLNSSVDGRRFPVRDTLQLAVYLAFKGDRADRGLPAYLSNLA